ncbi:MAG: D-ribose pyranase [Deltaproteobacteria bacterium]|jgi:D-ribose pyranase|nr:D-ribose pyranase [Deltaproteobacteria bacterium]MBT4525984.1 D-ribose pyranase [Deltaproteobacteria bacterium]
MKRKGIYNTELSHIVAKMGHGDMILIGDVGCPFPRHELTTCIDLAVTENIPVVNDVLRVVLEELEIEEYIVSEETKEISPNTYAQFKKTIDSFDNKGNALVEKVIPHANMKDLWLNGSLRGDEVKAFVRTGERTPYSYIILVAGVNF